MQNLAVNDSSLVFAVYRSTCDHFNSSLNLYNEKFNFICCLGYSATFLQ